MKRFSYEENVLSDFFIFKEIVFISWAFAKRTGNETYFLKANLKLKKLLLIERIRGVFQNPVKHLRWKICENCSCLSAINSFCKYLHLRCLIVFWIRLWGWMRGETIFPLTKHTCNISNKICPLHQHRRIRSCVRYFWGGILKVVLVVHYQTPPYLKMLVMILIMKQILILLKQKHPCLQGRPLEWSTNLNLKEHVERVSKDLESSK